MTNKITEAMIRAGRLAWGSAAKERNLDEWLKQMYLAMQAASPVDEGLVEPFAYAYRYPTFPPQGATVIRFTHGEEINGSKPLETIPLYTAAALQSLSAEIAAMRKERDLAEQDKHERGNRIEALSAQQKMLVEAAYREGWNAGINYQHPQTEEQSWIDSEARQALSSIGDGE